MNPKSNNSTILYFDNIMIRKIIHIDMDAFFASVEQRDNPELQGKPVAVGGSSKRGVVAAASYEARKFGVFSAMPSVTAFRKCPDIIFVKPRFDVYKKVSQSIRDIFYEYTDLVEPLSLDEAYLDVTHNKIGLPSATLIAREIKQKIKDTENLTASAGISINKFLAKVASDMDKPDGLYVIPPDQVQGFIDTLPVKKFFGVGKVTAKKMNEMGIYFGKDLKGWSESSLVSKFGKTGHYFFKIANGEDDREVNPERIRKSVSVENTFEEDIEGLEGSKAGLEPMVSRLASWVSRNKTYGRTLTLKIKYNDFKQITRSRTVSQIIKDEDTIRSLAHELLEQVEDFDKGIRLLGIGISNLIESEGTIDPQLTLDL